MFTRNKKISQDAAGAPVKTKQVQVDEEKKEPLAGNESHDFQTVVNWLNNKDGYTTFISKGVKTNAFSGPKKRDNDAHQPKDGKAPPPHLDKNYERYPALCQMLRNAYFAYIAAYRDCTEGGIVLNANEEQMNFAEFVVERCCVGPTASIDIIIGMMCGVKTCGGIKDGTTDDLRRYGNYLRCSTTVDMLRYHFYTQLKAGHPNNDLTITGANCSVEGYRHFASLMEKRTTARSMFDEYINKCSAASLGVGIAPFKYTPWDGDKYQEVRKEYDDFKGHLQPEDEEHKGPATPRRDPSPVPESTPSVEPAIQAKQEPPSESKASPVVKQEPREESDDDEPLSPEVEESKSNPPPTETPLVKKEPVGEEASKDESESSAEEESSDSDNEVLHIHPIQPKPLKPLEPPQDAPAVVHVPASPNPPPTSAVVPETPPVAKGPGRFRRAINATLSIAGKGAELAGKGAELAGKGAGLAGGVVQSAGGLLADAASGVAKMTGLSSASRLIATAVATPLAETSDFEYTVLSDPLRSQTIHIPRIKANTKDGIVWTVYCDLHMSNEHDNPVTRLIACTMAQFTRRYGIRLEGFCRVQFATTADEVVALRNHERNKNYEQVLTVLAPRETPEKKKQLESVLEVLLTKEKVYEHCSVHGADEKFTATGNGLTRVFERMYAVRVRCTRYLTRNKVQALLKACREKDKNLEAKSMDYGEETSIFTTQPLPRIDAYVSPYFMSELRDACGVEYFMSDARTIDSFVASAASLAHVLGDNAPTQRKYREQAVAIAAFMTHVAARERFFYWYTMFHALYMRPVLDTAFKKKPKALQCVFLIEGKDIASTKKRGPVLHALVQDVFQYLGVAFVSNIRVLLEHPSLFSGMIAKAEVKLSDRSFFAYHDWEEQKNNLPGNIAKITNAVIALYAQEHESFPDAKSDVLSTHESLVTEFNIARQGDIGEAVRALAVARDPYRLDPRTTKFDSLSAGYNTTYLPVIVNRLFACRAEDRKCDAQSIAIHCKKMNLAKILQLNLELTPYALHLLLREGQLHTITTPGLFGLNSVGVNDHVILQCLPPTTDVTKSISPYFATPKPTKNESFPYAVSAKRTSSFPLPFTDSGATPLPKEATMLLKEMYFPWIFTVAFRIYNALTADTVRPKESADLCRYSCDEFSFYLNDEVSLVRDRDSAHGEPAFLLLFWFTVKYLRKCFDNKPDFAKDLAFVDLLVSQLPVYERYHKLLLAQHKQHGFQLNLLTDMRLCIATVSFLNNTEILKEYGQFDKKELADRMFPFSDEAPSDIALPYYIPADAKEQTDNRQYITQAYQSLNMGAMCLLQARGDKENDPSGEPWLDFPTVAALVSLYIGRTNKGKQEDCTKDAIAVLALMEKARNPDMKLD